MQTHMMSWTNMGVKRSQQEAKHPDTVNHGVDTPSFHVQQKGFIILVRNQQLSVCEFLAACERVAALNQSCGFSQVRLAGNQGMLANKHRHAPGAFEDYWPFGKRSFALPPSISVAHHGQGWNHRLRMKLCEQTLPFRGLKPLSTGFGKLTYGPNIFSSGDG